MGPLRRRLGSRRRAAALARALTATVVTSTLLAACAGPDAYPPIPDTGDVTTVPPIERGAGEPSEVVLPSVDGTTTTVVVIGPGRSTLGGRVDGPTGPLSGGTVRLERLVGESVATEDVPIAGDGTWERPDLLGGRYRVRAFSAPDFAMLEPEVLFLEDGRKELFLRVEQFGAKDVDAAIAPDPPIVDEAAHLVVRVASRSVDDDGVVRAVPRPDVTVSLSGTAGWTVLGEPQGVTDAKGQVLFTLACRRSGEQPLLAVLDGTASVPLGLPACVHREGEVTTTSSPDQTSTTGPGRTVPTFTTSTTAATDGR